MNGASGIREAGNAGKRSKWLWITTSAKRSSSVLRSCLNSTKRPPSFQITGGCMSAYKVDQCESYGDPPTDADYAKGKTITDTYASHLTTGDRFQLMAAAARAIATERRDAQRVAAAQYRRALGVCSDVSRLAAEAAAVLDAAAAPPAPIHVHSFGPRGRASCACGVTPEEFGPRCMRAYTEADGSRKCELDLNHAGKCGRRP